MLIKDSSRDGHQHPKLLSLAHLTYLQMKLSRGIVNPKLLKTIILRFSIDLGIPIVSM